MTTAWHSSVRYSLKLSPVMPPIVAPTSLATILSVLSLLRVSSVTTVNATNEAMPVKSAAHFTECSRGCTRPVVWVMTESVRHCCRTCPIVGVVWSSSERSCGGYLWALMTSSVRAYVQVSKRGGPGLYGEFRPPQRRRESSW